MEDVQQADRKTRLELWKEVRDQSTNSGVGGSKSQRPTQFEMAWPKKNEGTELRMKIGECQSCVNSL